MNEKEIGFRMTTEKAINLLKIEQQCVIRNSNNACDRNCASCDLVQNDADILEMYEIAIAAVEHFGTDENGASAHVCQMTAKAKKIVDALRCCVVDPEGNSNCSECPRNERGTYCLNRLKSDAANLIEQLSAELERVKRELKDYRK